MKTVDWNNFVADFAKKIEKYPAIKVPKRLRNHLFRELYKAVTPKLIVEKSNASHVPMVKGYVIVPKELYDRLTTSDKILNSWQQKIAGFNWDTARKTVDGMKAIFGVYFTEDELAAFKRFRTKNNLDKSSFEYEELDSFRQALVTDKDWTPDEPT